MPESEERFEKRLQMQAQANDLVSAIEQSSDSAQDKTVELLAMIARLMIEQNFNLETIHNELFDHTLALDAMSDR